MEIDINNEEEILEKINFDTCNNSKECSRELCMFYNSIGLLKQVKKFDYRRALIDLGKIYITLDNQDNRIKELEKIRDKGNQKLENFYNEKIDKLDSDYNKHFNELIEENQQLKYQLEEKDKEIDKAKKEIEQLNQQLKEIKYYDKTKNCYFKHRIRRK